MKNYTYLRIEKNEGTSVLSGSISSFCFSESYDGALEFGEFCSLFSRDSINKILHKNVASKCSR